MWRKVAAAKPPFRSQIRLLTPGLCVAASVFESAQTRAIDHRQPKSGPTIRREATLLTTV
jgi:hypothetical protein